MAKFLENFGFNPTDGDENSAFDFDTVRDYDESGGTLATFSNQGDERCSIGAGGEWHGPVRDKGGAVYNVKHPDFGAAGDGVTDDTGAIQAARDAAIDAGFRVIYAPPGTYKVDASTHLRGVVVIGDGASFDGIDYPILPTRPPSVRTVSRVGAGAGCVTIWYDDANESDYTEAFPVHKALGLPGASSIHTDLVGNADRLTWDQIKEMHGSGLWTVANHARDNVDLTTLSASEQRDYIETAFEKLRTELGTPPLWFVPPQHKRDANIDTLSYRLHRAQRLGLGTITLHSHPGTRAYTRLYSKPANENVLPDGISDVEAWLDELEPLVKYRGFHVGVHFHGIRDSHAGQASSIGRDVWLAVLEGLYERQIPVVDADSLARPAHNLVEDPSFENGEWSLDDNDGAASIVTAENQSGTRCVKLSATSASGSGRPEAYIFVPILPRTRTYEVHMWAKASRATGTYKVSLTAQQRTAVRESDGTFFSPHNDVVTTDWAVYGGEITVTRDTEHLRIAVGLEVTDDIATDVWIDSISLVPADAYNFNAVNYP